MNDDRLSRIRQRLQERLAPSQLDIVDDSAQHVGHLGGESEAGHFSVRIVSQRFSGQSSVARHRLVYEALGDLMKTDIHALSIKALAPEELTAKQ
ncbi:MAG: BolA family transcriptional regulator [Gammaproteobacteria bacterium]|nr:BolA family transcriptional regulator [Gammaproteobacteria bacterium]